MSDQSKTKTTETSHTNEAPANELGFFERHDMLSAGLAAAGGTVLATGVIAGAKAVGGKLFASGAKKKAEETAAGLFGGGGGIGDLF